MSTERAKERKGTSSLTAIDPYWLAGFLEVTGVITLARSNKLATVGASFSTTVGNLTQLQGVFASAGIATSMSEGDKPKLRIQGDEAMKLLPMLPPEVSTTIAETPSQDTSTLYNNLVQHDAFLAGAIDGRRSIHSVTTARNGTHAELFFSSTNLFLLRAIEDRYTSKTNDRRSRIRTNETGGRLAYSHRRAHRVYQDVEPHLILKRDLAAEVFAPPSREKSQEEIEQEAFANKHAKYLAGFFELAGSISFKPTTHRNGDVGLSPIIKITGNMQKIEVLGRFLDIFSPFFREEQTILRGEPFHNHSLTISGLKALPIIKAIAPFLGNRPDVKQLLVEWDKLSPQQRAQRWQEIKAYPPQNNHPDYDELVKDPQYVAGILDAHKTFGFREKTAGDRRTTLLYPIANITSTNRALLDALHAQYGGYDVLAIAETTSHTWKVESADLRRLYNVVKDDLIIQQERANEILGWADAAQIETHLLTTLLNSSSPLSEEDLRSHLLQRVADTEDNVHYVSHAEVEDYLQRLLSAGRITQTGEKAHPVYTATLDAQNIAAIEKSPRATLQLLINGLEPNATLIISQTGRIIGVESDAHMTWYIPDAQARDVKDKLAQRRNGVRRQRIQGEEPFVQVRAGGMIVDKVSTITTISNMKELEAVQEALQHTIEQSMLQDWEDNMEREQFPLDPEVAARQIITMIRSGKQISLESLLPKA